MSDRRVMCEASENSISMCQLSSRKKGISERQFVDFLDKSKIRENDSSHSGQIFTENLAGVT
jgi:hypothetical protein